MLINNKNGQKRFNIKSKYDSVYCVEKEIQKVNKIIKCEEAHLLYHQNQWCMTKSNKTIIS